MAKTVEDYHRDFLTIIDGDWQRQIRVRLTAAGHQAIRALIEEIHDQGYALGQRHAEGIFDEGEEVEDHVPDHVINRLKADQEALERQIEGTFG